MTFYERFANLCKGNGISCKKAAREIGLSNSITTKWKITGATPNGETLLRVSDYFGVTVNCLIGKDERQITPAPIKIGRFELRDMKIFLDGCELPYVTEAEIKCKGSVCPYVSVNLSIPLRKASLRVDSDTYKQESVKV